MIFMLWIPHFINTSVSLIMKQGRKVGGWNPIWGVAYIDPVWVPAMHFKRKYPCYRGPTPLPLQREGSKVTVQFERIPCFWWNSHWSMLQKYSIEILLSCSWASAIFFPFLPHTIDWPPSAQLSCSSCIIMLILHIYCLLVYYNYHPPLRLFLKIIHLP